MFDILLNLNFRYEENYLIMIGNLQVIKNHGIYIGNQFAARRKYV